MPRWVVPLVALLLTVGVWRGSTVAAPPHYTMSVVVDYEAASFSGDLRVKYQNTTGIELGELFFRLYPNGGEIYGNASIRVTETFVDERPVDTETFVEETVLLVPLPEVLPLDGQVTVTIAFEGNADDWRDGATPPTHAYGLLTRSEHTLTLTAFYPILAFYTEEGWALDPVFAFGDALMSEASDYQVSLTVPTGITPVASGTLTDRVEGEEATSYRFSIEAARDFSAVLFEAHEQNDDTVDGVALRTWFTPEHRRAANIALNRASEALGLFGELLGPPPYHEIDLVEVPMQHAAGVEFSGLILIASAYAANPDDVFYDIIVSHEMAHQWFYAGVGSDVTESPWVDESVVTYLSNVFLETFGEPGAASEALDAWDHAYDRAHTDDPTASIASPVYAFSQSSSYSGFVYSGGALFVHAVRETIGDGPFFAALASYYRKHAGGIASPADLISAFEASCDCRLIELLVEYGLHP